MRKKTDDLKVNVEKFFLLLQNYSDDPESTVVFVRFLRTFLRTDATKEALPTIEVMTLIKQQKPIVFQSMRKLSEKDNVLAFLTGLSMDTQEAENRLQLICEDKSAGK